VNGNDPAMDWTMLAGSTLATIVGGITWRLRKGALTQVAFFAGIVMCVMSAINFSTRYETFPFWVIGAILVAIGTLWVGLGLNERILPVRTALALGCYAALQGFQMMVAGEDGFILWAAMVAIGFSIAAVVASIYVKRAILLGFGSVGIIMFSMVTVMEMFGGRAGAPILLLVMGIVFIAVAVVAAKVAPRIRRTPPTTPHSAKLA